MKNSEGFLSENEFETILENHIGLIYKVAHSYCDNPNDQQDLVQEIIIQLWKSYKNFSKESKLSTWLYRVATNVAISFYRKDAKWKQMSTTLDDSIVEIAAEQESSESDEKLAQLHQFISELGELDRVLMLLYLEDKPQKEIAEILGISETNVSTKIARIKSKLKIKFILTD